MIWIRGSYRTNHPKDKNARKAKELQGKLRGVLCSRDETLSNKEEDIRKHVKRTDAARPDLMQLKEYVHRLDPEDEGWGNEENLRK